MKKNLLFAIFLLAAAGLTAQSLAPGKIDIINNTYEYPYATYLLEADASSFYRISWTNSDFLDHSLLSDITNDASSIYFIKYDNEGTALKANTIMGPNVNSYSSLMYAASFQGGLMIKGSANNDISTGGSTISLTNSDQLEFIATYDADCQLTKLLNIWELTVDQYVNSEAIMDPEDGSIYIYGEATDPIVLRSYGPLGEDLSTRYFYLIKYNHNLDFQWVQTFGYDMGQSGQSPYLEQVQVFPGNNGEVLLTGIYGNETSLVIKGIPLSPYANDFGTFAVLLNSSGSLTWMKSGRVNETNVGTYGNDYGIFKAVPMSDGGFVLAGNTTSGYYKLGDAEFTFSSSTSQNQFVFRIDKAGDPLWEKGIASQGPMMLGKKKSASSETFEQYVYYDAVSWKKKILYVTGTFQNTAFSLANKVLPKNYDEGIYVAGLDMDDGKVLWGYGISSDYVEIYGFDVDLAGNVSIMGSNQLTQAMEELDVVVPVDAFKFLFHLGLDFNGKPIWYNNISLSDSHYSLSGTDLEILPNGEVFASMKVDLGDNILSIGGESFSVAFRGSWLVGLTPGMLLGGTVKDESGNPVNPGYVRAIKMAPMGSYPTVDSTLIQSNGGYLFTSLYPGFYALQAVPDPVQYPDALPTYYGNWIAWQDVTFNDIQIAYNMNTLDIVVEEVPKLTPEDGSGNMSGSVLYEEEESSRKSTMARPVKKAGVILLKKSKKSTMAGALVAYLETDDLGMFAFDNVPDGDYILLVDIPGLEMLETHEVSIVENAVVSGLDYIVSDEGIAAVPISSGISFLENRTLKAWPNPGEGILLMDLPASGNYVVKVYSATGKLILSREMDSAGGATNLNFADEQDGIYFISVAGPETNSTIKYIKR